MAQLLLLNPNSLPYLSCTLGMRKWSELGREKQVLGFVVCLLGFFLLLLFVFSFSLAE